MKTRLGKTKKQAITTVTTATTKAKASKKQRKYKKQQQQQRKLPMQSIFQKVFLQVVYLTLYQKSAYSLSIYVTEWCYLLWAISL